MKMFKAVGQKGVPNTDNVLISCELFMTNENGKVAVGYYHCNGCFYKFNGSGTEMFSDHFGFGNKSVTYWRYLDEIKIEITE